MKHLLLGAAALVSVGVAMPAAAQIVVNPTTIGQRVIVASTDDVIARFVDSTALLSSNLFLDGRSGIIFNNQNTPVGTTVNLGSFAVGTELVFRIETSDGNIFRTGPAERNPDGLFHAAVSTTDGETFVGFEDQLNGGDRDYDDLIFAFTNVAATPAAVPEPAAWGMMLGGFGVIGTGLRSRRRRTTVTYA